MKYTEITVYTTTAGSELVSDIFWRYTEDGVAVSDVNDILALAKEKKGTWDYIDDGLLAPAPVLCKGYVRADRPDIVQKIERELSDLKERAEIDVGTLETAKREVEGDAWIESWKEHFRPFSVGKITICPAWVDYTPAAGETCVKIDSFMAFGTGEHETTAMCLELLQKYLKRESSVIDVGCGSGILGVAAAKLGAEDVLMTDIDECAVTAAQANAAINGVENCRVELKNLLDDENCKGDLILANIMAEILVGFAPKIGANLKENGVIVLSGILLSKENFVKEAFSAQGFCELETVRRGEWAAVAMTR